MVQQQTLRFNPCFNGSYSYTKNFKFTTFIGRCSFNPCFNGSYSYTDVSRRKSSISIGVSILVLMEVTLILDVLGEKLDQSVGFQSLF